MVVGIALGWMEQAFHCHTSSDNFLNVCIWWLELAFGWMELHLVGLNRPYSVTPDWMALSLCFCIRMEWAFGWMEQAFLVTPDQMQLSQCFAYMPAGIGVWSNEIALGWMEQAIHCNILLDGIVAVLYFRMGMEWAFNWMELAPWFQFHIFARSVLDLCVINDYLVGKNWNYPKDWCCTYSWMELMP